MLDRKIVFFTLVKFEGEHLSFRMKIEFLGALLSLASFGFSAEVATFSVDVTPPIGHQLFTGGGVDSVAVNDSLFAKGFVISGGGLEKPAVFVSVDWAEIRNDAFDRWREVLAEAAGTDRVRVLVSAIHQHDTPLPDLAAQKILNEAGADTQLIDPDFHEKTVQKVAAAIREAMKNSRTISHFGIGKAEAEGLASNRRFVNSEGEISYGRGSGGQNLAGRIAPVGTIDPWVKTLSFWDGDEAVCALSIYATHPMSVYRTARISADFPGIARAARQKKTPSALQIYASGASGNITVGKFNDHKMETRIVFAERLETAMTAAWDATKKHPVSKIEFKSEELMLDPRVDGDFTKEKLNEQLNDTSQNRMKRGMAALGLSWQKRCEAGQPIDVPMLDFGGKAQLILLPGEIYVEYQIAVQELRPDSFVMTAGYGECGPGYIPTKRAWEENDSNLSDWCWVAPGQEEKIRAVLKRLLEQQR